MQQQQRPQVKGGYDCTDGCASATQTGRDRQCQSSDFRWDLVDLIHWHPGLRAAANGSLAWDEKSGGAAVCDPTHTDTNNHSAFVRTVREDFNVTILQQLQPPKLQDDLLHLFTLGAASNAKSGAMHGMGNRTYALGSHARGKGRHRFQGFKSKRHIA